MKIGDVETETTSNFSFTVGYIVARHPECSRVVMVEADDDDVIYRHAWMDHFESEIGRERIGDVTRAYFLCESSGDCNSSGFVMPENKDVSLAVSVAVSKWRDSVSDFLSVTEMPEPGTVVELLLRDGSVVQTIVGDIEPSLVRGWRYAVAEPAVESEDTVAVADEPVAEEPVVEDVADGTEDDSDE